MFWSVSNTPAQEQKITQTAKIDKTIAILDAHFQDGFHQGKDLFRQIFPSGLRANSERDVDGS